MNAPPPPPPDTVQVVQHKQPIKLADLYKKAKAKGVLTSFTHYPN